MSSTGQQIADTPIRSILVVDDDRGIRTLLAKALERAGYDCQCVDTAESAVERISARAYDLVITDIAMPGMDGIELLKKIKSTHPDTDVMVMTGHTSAYSYADIMNAGASDYMTKPFNIRSSLARINRIAREKQNIINLKKTNQELCAAIDRANILTREAREASKAKTFFLASMSHEIRTPLNGIVGYTEMLLDTPLNEEQHSFLKHAKGSCEALLSVVNDILDFSKVEAGKIVFENIGFDPEVLCFDAIDLVRPQVDESQVELLCSVADSVPGQVLGDPHRFRQVLLNLLSNAVKFTEKGVIKVCVDAEPIDAANSRLTIRVQDTGIGIAQGEIDNIFIPFIQSEKDITSRYGGTGLGLSISKNIAQKMGGDVWAESRLNQGSVFYFSACFTILENKKVTRILPADVKQKKILVSTLSDEARKILLHELTLADMDISHVDFQDLEAFLSNQETPCFDIAIIDFGKIFKMAEKDFSQLIQSIRPDRWRFNFIACSVPAPGMAEMFRRAGYKGFLPKPVSRHRLFEMVSYVMGMDKGNGRQDEVKTQIVTAHMISENRKYSTSILLVEDNPVNQRMTKLMLSKAGYMIDIASDGAEAVAKYTASPAAYDMIFMDINMPQMDGLQATEKIRLFERQNRIDSKIPILALTANVLHEFQLRCTAAGMDDFLTKPIKRDLVFQAIQKWSNKKKALPIPAL